MKKLTAFLCGALCLCTVFGMELQKLSLEAMDWDIPNVVPWGWKNGTVFNFSNGGYIFSRNTPYSKEAACEFTMVMNRKINKKGRAEAAIVLCSHDRACRWLFGPVAERDGKTKIELKLFINNKFMKGENCRIKLDGEKNIRWKYAIPYTFRLQVKNGIGTGTVLDADKKVLARITATPGKRVIDSAKFPMRTAIYTTGLTTVFSDARASFGKEIKLPREKVEKPARYDLPPHAPDVKGRATGFFHVEKFPDGKWWIIDPNGYGFYANGIDAIYYRGNFCEELGYSPYYKNIKAEFPTVHSWVKHTSARLKSWGFNFIGTGEPALRKNFAYSINLMLGSSFAAFGDEYNITPYKGRPNTALPNVFHPRFQEYCERKIANNSQRLHDPFCLGLFSDNELRWHGGSLNPDGSGVFDSAMAKNKNHSAKTALTGFLEKRYNGDIGLFNKNWQTSFESFDALKDASSLPSDTDNALQDKQDFLYLMAHTYFRKIKAAMEKSAPNHMYIGCRSAGITSAHEKVWLAAGKFCDIVTVNQYPVMDFDKGEIYVHLTGEAFDKAFGRLYNMTKRPIMITEWSFLSMDSGLPNTRGAGQRVRTEKERAVAGEMFLRASLSLPFMVGHNFYMYLDYPEQGSRKNHPEDGNYGIVNVKNEPYNLMTEMFRRNQSGNPSILRNAPHPAPASDVTAGRVYEKLTRAAGNKTASNTEFQVKKSDSSYSVSNGTLELRGNKSSAAINIYYKGRKIGRYNLMARYLDKNAATVWRDASVIQDISISKNEAVSLKMSVKADKFLCRTEIILPQKSNYFMTRVTEISNPHAKDTLSLEGLYFRAYADFNIDFSKNHRFYDKFAYWIAKDKSCCFGGAASGTRVAYYYHGTQKNQCPDGFFMFRQILKPGEKIKIPIPCYAFTFAADNVEHANSTVSSLINGDLGLKK